jgi:protein arginine kinase activator
MGKSLKCDLCSNHATVHLTQILNNQIHKVNLCESCAQAKGITDPNGFSLADLLIKSSSAEPSPAGQLTCESCGFTQADFKKLGRLGCPACYQSFDPLLSPILSNMHKGEAHIGKVPQRALARKTLHDRINLLQKDLHEAIQAERYEDAARFRDEIQRTKEGLQPSKN